MTKEITHEFSEKMIDNKNSKYTLYISGIFGYNPYKIYNTKIDAVKEAIRYELWELKQFSRKCPYCGEYMNRHGDGEFGSCVECEEIVL